MGRTVAEKRVPVEPTAGTAEVQVLGRAAADTERAADGETLETSRRGPRGMSDPSEMSDDQVLGRRALPQGGSLLHEDYECP